ncbi:hypothetical protein AZO1586R_772 [Bathymodiolus azoricus thioautotrophic gill symbiont]|uniref:Uncharacterized protein n=1 Tax=Bathymodiolus azoricus thioautotrophic gill symbiont TaxID=235205 RepID=A0ACA8ZPA2_9GAMM|nr:hypothetical protein [Bathymodiolus azoricus thioautotrophic gill symbiont]CAB5498487.1 hypothetical protein AZO1586R_772 [Bathymodiolus azoricus thioautotrophic gill symbiont]
MKLNLLKNAGKVLGFTETPSLSSYLKKQSNPLLKATGKTLYFLDFFIDDETPDYLKQSSNNYWDKVVDAEETYQNGLDGAQRFP